MAELAGQMTEIKWESKTKMGNKEVIGFILRQTKLIELP